MRIVDAVDLFKTQYRSFRLLLEIGARNSPIQVIRHEDLPREVKFGSREDIIVISPYGRWVNAIRQGLKTEAFILMVDLKGPAGIDSANMVAERAERFAYASPMVGDRQFDDYFRCLLENGIKVFPLPYFPAAPLITETDIIDAKSHNRNRIERVAYAGSIWGSRRLFIDRLRESISDSLVVRQKLSAIEYASFLRNSLVGLDFAGAEMATYRFSEVLLAGCACVCQRRSFFVLPPCPIPGRDFLNFSTAEELIDSVQLLLADPEHALTIGASGKSWYHSTQSPARYLSYILEIVGDRHRPREIDDFSPDTFWSIEHKQ